MNATLLLPSFHLGSCEHSLGRLRTLAGDRASVCGRRSGSATLKKCLLYARSLRTPTVPDLAHCMFVPIELRKVSLRIFRFGGVLMIH